MFNDKKLGMHTSFLNKCVGVVVNSKAGRRSLRGQKSEMKSRGKIKENL
jgi:hypothetical protein